MSIEQVNTVDAIGVDKSTGEVVMTIADHLPWNKDEPETEHEHMLLLQEKINAYLGFVESGEILKSYPVSQGKKVRIEVIGKYQLSTHAEKFFSRARGIVQDAGVKLDFKLHVATQDT